jgi:hypothetical protein
MAAEMNEAGSGEAAFAKCDVPPPAHALVRNSG